MLRSRNHAACTGLNTGIVIALRCDRKQTITSLSILRADYCSRYPNKCVYVCLKYFKMTIKSMMECSQVYLLKYYRSTSVILHVLYLSVFWVFLKKKFRFTTFWRQIFVLFTPTHLFVNFSCSLLCRSHAASEPKHYVFKQIYCIGNQMKKKRLT